MSGEEFFTVGAVIGSKEFGNEAFASARFGAKQKDGTRAMKSSGSGAKGGIWSARDLRVGIRSDEILPAGTI